MYRGVSTYTDLQKVICDAGNNWLTFRSVLPQPGSTMAYVIGRRSDKDRKLLVRPDDRVHNLEYELDKLTNHLADFTLFKKKSQANSSKQPGSGRLQVQAGSRVCAYCKTLVTELANAPVIHIVT